MKGSLNEPQTKQQQQQQQPPVAKRVAIIGGGAGGLVVLRECLREGHEAWCFEQGSDVGGVWRFSSATDTDLLGVDPHRAVVHSSMYRGLRTNLPRHIMGFSDFPMDPEGQAMQLATRVPGTGALELEACAAALAHAATTSRAGAPAAAAAHPLPRPQDTLATDLAQSAAPPPLAARRGQPVGACGLQAWEEDSTARACASIDGRLYPRHEEVQRYLRAFAAWYGLHRAVRCNTRVLRARPVPVHTPQQQWQQQRGSTDSGPQHWEGVGQQAMAGVKWLLDIETRPLFGPEQSQTQQTQQTQQAQQQQASFEQHEFDAVVVANGHYTEPNLPDVPGMATSPVFQMHSHNYRAPDRFRGQVVVVVGASNSGDDISREVAAVAKAVHLCARTHTELDPGPPGGPHQNMFRQPMLTALTNDGRAVFPGGFEECVDAVIYCTGYRYTFPFLPGVTRFCAPGAAQLSSFHMQQQQQQQDPHTMRDGHAALSDLSRFVVSEGQHVQPLYKHMFPPALAPSLSFVGLPWKIVPFPQMEIQAKLIARVLSGRAWLPEREQMSQEAQQHVEGLRQAGTPLRYAHMQNLAQFAYNDELTDMCGGDVPRLPAWRQAMYIAAGLNKRSCPENYRDVWTEEALLKEAELDIKQQLAAMEAAAAACLQ